MAERSDRYEVTVVERDPRVHSARAEEGLARLATLAQEMITADADRRLELAKEMTELTGRVRMSLRHALSTTEADAYSRTHIFGGGPTHNWLSARAKYRVHTRERFADDKQYEDYIFLFLNGDEASWSRFAAQIGWDPFSTPPGGD
jgi:hypothetical protein